jgi:hypothetical protein
MKNCKKCNGEYEETGQEFYDRIGVPEPSDCFDCRLKARLAFRNEKILYKRKCDLCAKNIVSTYHDEVEFPVYCQECFWGDKWNALDFEMELSMEESFFEQFTQLMKKVPRLALVNKQSQNSEYCNYSFANKNCYLTFGNHYEEDCMYGRYSTKNKDCVDYLWLYGSELCYECTFSKNCYKSVYLDHCENCNDSYFSFDLKGCKNCLFSNGLRNKQYYIFNEKYDQKGYEEYFENLQMNVDSQWEKLREGWEKFKKEKGMYEMNYQISCEDCEGNNLQNSKNLKHCFNCTACEDCANGYQMDETYSSIDNNHMGYDRCELCYNCVGCSAIFNCRNCDSCWDDNDLDYCNLCFSSKDCFGSVGMRRGQYCILNKQYSKEEYEEKVKGLIEKMKADGEWGEFFPVEAYPFAYNETVAQEYFPLTKEEALKEGFQYHEEEKIVAEADEKVMVCEVMGKQFKIVPKEMAFYEKMGIPLPKRCPDQRHLDRSKLSSPLE